MNPLLLLCCGMAIVVGGMLWLRLHPFLTMMAVLLAPLLHRMLHKFHLDDDDEEK